MFSIFLVVSLSQTTKFPEFYEAHITVNTIGVLFVGMSGCFFIYDVTWLQGVRINIDFL